MVNADHPTASGVLAQCDVPLEELRTLSPEQRRALFERFAAAWRAAGMSSAEAAERLREFSAHGLPVPGVKP